MAPHPVPRPHGVSRTHPFRRDTAKFGLDVRGLSLVLRSPVPPRRWESFAFQCQQWGFGAVTVAVAPAGWLVTGAGFHPL